MTQFITYNTLSLTTGRAAFGNFYEGLFQLTNDGLAVWATEDTEYDWMDANAEHCTIEWHSVENDFLYIIQDEVEHFAINQDKLRMFNQETILIMLDKALQKVYGDPETISEIDGYWKKTVQLFIDKKLNKEGGVEL
jgi:hypothetical protein